MNLIKFSFLFLFLSLCIPHSNSQELKDRYNPVESQGTSTDYSPIITVKYQRILAQLDSLRMLEVRNVDAEIFAHIQKAETEYKLGQLSESEKSGIEALQLLNYNDVSPWRVTSKTNILNHLGRIKIEAAQYDKSVTYFQQALDLSTDATHRSQILNNIAFSLYKSANYAPAIENYKRSLALISSKNEKILEARILSNLGLSQSKIADKNALSNLNRALIIRDSLHYKPGMVTSHLHLSEYFKSQDSTKKALYHAKKALGIATVSKLVPLEKAALANMLSLSNYDLAQRFAFLVDSINMVNQTTSNKYAEAKYNVELAKSKSEKNVEQLRLKNKYNIIITLIILTSLLGAGILLFYRSNQKNKIALIKESITTENRISVRIHDELANDVYNAMVKLQNKTDQDTDLINDLDHIYQRVRNISLENSPIDEDVDFSSQLNDLFLSYKNNGVNILTRHITPVDWSRLKSHEKTTIYRSFQELLINMKKHSQATHVLISFQKIGSKIKAVFKDNGVGCELIKGNGLSNVENRIKSINGTITFDTQKKNGFTAIIII